MHYIFTSIFSPFPRYCDSFRRGSPGVFPSLKCSASAILMGLAKFSSDSQFLEQDVSSSIRKVH